MDSNKTEKKEEIKLGETNKTGESPIGDNIKGIQQSISTIVNSNVNTDVNTSRLTPSQIRKFQENSKAPLPNNSPIEERWPHLDVITDIGTTITDLKSGLLDYYGTLFIPSEQDLSSKIDSLRTQDTIHGNYESNRRFINNRDIQVSKDNNGFGVFHKIKNAPLLDDIPDPWSPVPNSIFSYRDVNGNPISEKCKMEDSEMMDFHGLAEIPGKGIIRAANCKSNKTSRGPTSKSDKSNKAAFDQINIEGDLPENLLGFDLKDLAARGALSTRARIPYNDIGEMMECISRNCKDVQNKLSFFEDTLSSYQSNPNMAQFIPPVNESRRFLKNFHSKDPIATYIYTLYRDLYNKSEINSKRIEVIKAKLKVLQSHSKPKMVRIAVHSSLGI
ncbi:uncharacterized protein cubi_01373 [Cryptosporidium ubiquitum]|uniref:Uncharacterized protein n=1 Tax=Cryptosporidium ubiquitum TaxID=857276 RepID=A0A1J4MCS4_9CRYT|nr:uncharacterized protein cubi_01373 [Cryptosporidium ubiquitum]OII72040.1 hypothetical protein cubi_01373 [Cryptosporidium ubiquitum]